MIAINIFSLVVVCVCMLLMVSFQPRQKFLLNISPVLVNVMVHFYLFLKKL